MSVTAYQPSYELESVPLSTDIEVWISSAVSPSRLELLNSNPFTVSPEYSLRSSATVVTPLVTPSAGKRVTTSHLSEPSSALCTAIATGDWSNVYWNSVSAAYACEYAENCAGRSESDVETRTAAAHTADIARFRFIEIPPFTGAKPYLFSL